VQRHLLILALFFTSSFVAGQDEVIKDYSPADFERFVKDDLKKTFKVVRKGKSAVTYDIEATPYFADLYSGDRFVLFYRGFPAKAFNNPVTLEKVNEWNVGAVISRAYLVDNGNEVKFEATMDFAGGLTRKQAIVFYARLENEFGKFVQFFGGLANQKNSDAGVDAAPDNVTQTFPAKAEEGKHHTSWDIEWDFVRHQKGKNSADLLRIRSAKFSFKDNKGQWKSVLVARNIELVEAFAAYDDGTTAFLDLAGGYAMKTVPARKDLLGPNCVAPGQILTRTGQPHFRIYREVHDDGIRWLTRDDNRGYRGEKLILCSVFQAFNYVYLVEFDFTDDGRILCRLGFTAHNYFDRNQNKAPGGDTHVHVGCWRMDFALSDPVHNAGGPEHNDYRLIRRASEGKRFKVVSQAFGATEGDDPAQACEGCAKWASDEFSVLRVVSNRLKNSHGYASAYDLIPSQFGSVSSLPTAGSVKANMDFVKSSFWITRSEGRAAYHELPDKIKQRRPLAGEPATVWFAGANLHVPRSEDFNPQNGTSTTGGVALTSWLDFTLRPRDLFDGTPLMAK
jgi:hypothetical protein